MNYVKNKGFLVGTFNEEEINNGVDKIKLNEMKEKTGLKYSNSFLVKKKGKIIGVRLYVCNVDDLDLTI